MRRYHAKSTLNLLIIGILCLTNLFGNVFALDDTNFTTNNTTGGNKPTVVAGPKGWGVQSVSCTTYTLAYEKSGETIPLDANYMITHVANGVLDVGGNLRLKNGVPAANTVDNEKNGYGEDVYMGYNSGSTRMYRVICNGQLFDDKATSAQNFNGEYRHVVNWLVKQEIGKKCKIYAADQGLDDDDKKVLWNLAYIQAQKNKDNETKQILENIQNGTMKWAIKMEAKLAIRTPVTVSCHKNGMNIETIENAWSMLTYKEVQYVNRQANSKYGETIRRYLGEISEEISENDTKYLNGEESGAGFDWIECANTFPIAKTTVTINYKNEKNGELIAGIGDNPVGPEDRNPEGYYYKDLTSNGYTYTGVEIDDSEKDLKNYINILDDKKTHEITFWYKQDETKTLVTINYKDEKTGELITDFMNPEYYAEPGTYTRKDLESRGYIYTSVEVDDNKKDSSKTSITISDDKQEHEITFWYKKDETKTLVTVNYKNEKTGKLISGFTNPEYYTKSGTYTKKDLESRGYIYTGVEVDNNKKDSNKKSVTISDDKKEHEITFWYKQDETKTLVTVNYKNEKTGKLISGFTNPEYYTKSGTYTKKDLESRGYIYTGVEVDDNKKDSSKTSITISDDKQEHEITFWYKQDETKTLVTINYKEEKTGELITSFTNPEYYTKQGIYTRKDLDSKGYTYTGVEVNKPNYVAKDSNKTSVVIPDDKQEHEITFWYKKEDITKIKVTHRSESGIVLYGPTEFVIKNGDVAKTFSKQPTAMGLNYEYTGLEIISPEKAAKDPSKDSITIGFEGEKTYEIIFWYKMKTNVKVVCVREEDDKVFYQSSVDKLDVPLNKTYNESSYTPENYEYLGEYAVIKGTNAYTGKGTTSTGKSVVLNIEENSEAPNMILIVFYYKSNYSATIEHYYVDPIGEKADELRVQYNIAIAPGISKELSSINIKDKDGITCINLKYDGSNVTTNNFKQYTSDAYTLTLTPGQSNYTIRFYYTSQVIEVKHEKEDGTLLTEPIKKVLNPSASENPLADYTFKEYKLNDDSPKKDTSVKVPIKEGVPSQELVFIYKDPELIFDDDDPNHGKNPSKDPNKDSGKDPNTDPDSDSDYRDKINKYGVGIIPSDLNNQFVGQDATKYYWVLNENGEITIRLAVGHMDTGTHSLTCNLEIPFDVYIDKGYKKAQTSIPVTLTQNKSASDDEYDIYETSIKNIYVPIWVEEKEYEIVGKVEYVYTSANGKASDPITGNATANVTVVGALYDFTVTNLDGSDTTGDSMWNESLFSATTEYKADKLAIGQGTQQSSKYYQGIKRGTRFYFSLNTLGQANNQIEIVPNFYFVSADGKNTEKVTMKSNYINSTRSINLNDTNRVTTEFSKERAMKSKLGNTSTGTIFEVGNYSKITLNKDVNTPYLGIVNDVKTKFNGKELTAILQGTDRTDKDLYQSANHWYADYSVPNDATFYKADGTQVDENGYVTVYFTIKTKKSNKANDYYLAYNLDSPFVQNQKVSEWAYERDEESYKLNLPRGNVSYASRNVTTNDIWLEGGSTNASGHTAIVIYSLKSNVTTKQNITSAGTH